MDHLDQPSIDRVSTATSIPVFHLDALKSQSYACFVPCGRLYLVSKLLHTHHASMYQHMYILVDTCAHTHTHVQIQMHTHTTHVQMRMHTLTYARAITSAHTHTYTHTYAHANMDACTHRITSEVPLHPRLAPTTVPSLPKLTLLACMEASTSRTMPPLHRGMSTRAHRQE